MIVAKKDAQNPRGMRSIDAIIMLWLFIISGTFVHSDS